MIREHIIKYEDYYKSLLPGIDLDMFIDFVECYHSDKNKYEWKTHYIANLLAGTHMYQLIEYPIVKVLEDMACIICETTKLDAKTNS